MLVSLFVVMLVLAGCSSNSSTTKGKETTGGDTNVLEEENNHDEDDEHHEDTHHEEDSTRIAIGYNGGVIITDGKFNIIETLETETSAIALASDNRHIILNAREEGFLKLLDLGVWSEDHGDHGHIYAESPILSSYILEGDKPTHITAHGSKTAIFYDGDGSTEIYTNKSLTTEAKPKPLLTIPGVEHHGVAVPLTNGNYAISFTDEHDPQTLPDGIAIFNKAGEEISRFESCPRLHGEASTGSKEDEVVAFGCEGQVLLYTPHDNEGIELALPDKDARVGTIKSHNESFYMLGNYSSKEIPELGTNITIINTIDKSLRTLDLSTRYVGAMAVSRTGDGYVLGINGLLYQIDLANGSIKSEVKVVAPFEIVEGHGHGTVYPSIAVIDQSVLVTDPEKNEILHVTEETVKTVLSLDIQPTSIISVTAK